MEFEFETDTSPLLMLKFFMLIRCFWGGLATLAPLWPELLFEFETRVVFENGVVKWPA